ncbi:MAG: HEAT repeat domain-containing protein [Chloroflexi bacterium]|nr:HEAT repeat domain-containing protein [Chloroflexota bacterium]
MSLFKPNIPALKAKRDLAGLLLILKSKDALARRDAIKAFGDLGARSVVPALIQVLLADNLDVPEKADTATALGAIGDADAIDALVQANAISHTRERRMIETATTAPNRKYHEGFYITRIATDEYLFRSARAHALARIGGARALNALFDALASEAGQMANQVKREIQQAIQTAVQTRAPEILAILIEKLKDKSPDVRHWAVHCLSDWGDPEIADTFVTIACDEDEAYPVREAALMGLGEIGDRRALPFLEDLLKSGNRGIAHDADSSATRIRERHPRAPQI